MNVLLLVSCWKIAECLSGFSLSRNIANTLLANWYGDKLLGQGSVEGKWFRNKTSLGEEDIFSYFEINFNIKDDQSNPKVHN